MTTPFEATLDLARRDDPGLTAALAAWLDPETRGELLVEVWKTGTPGARRAVAEALARPFRRGTWQAWKRLWKLAEAGREAEAWVPLTATLDRARGSTWPVSGRTLEYLRRRAYRHLKGLAHREPVAFRAHVERLFPLYQPDDPAPVARRLLRLHLAGAGGEDAVAARFAPRLENPFAPANDQAEPQLALLELDDAALLTPAPTAPAPAALTAPAPATTAPPRPWPGPVFPEVWLADPAWLVAVLERTRQPALAGALARLLVERLGERALGVELGALYRLLEHPAPAAWRWALGQLAGRARRELLRFEELAGLAARLAEPEATPDPAVLADLLWILDDERADEVRRPLLPALRDLLARAPDSPGAPGLADFLRRHAPPGPASPLWSWARVIPLLRAGLREVRDLGGALAARLGDEERLVAAELSAVLESPWAEDDPDGVQRLLVSPGAVPGGYRPPGQWRLEALALGLDLWKPAAFEAARRALLALEEQGGLEAAVGLRLARGRLGRTRALGQELLAGALSRGALPAEELAGLLCGEAPAGEDVAAWARRALEAEAAVGRLPNQALYRLLDAVPRDVRGFARELVTRHLRRFQAGELVAFCAESPDATTAELGISLAEAALPAGERLLDLRALLPMFRVLLFRVGRDRQEKARLLQTLERWALAEREQAALAVDVVAAFRRSQARLEFSGAVGLLAKLGRRWPDLSLPFTARETFGAGRS